MEWRIVHGGPLDTSGTFTPDDLIPDAYRMKFDPEDVALIVFPDDDVMRLTLNDSDMKSFFPIPTQIFCYWLIAVTTKGQAASPKAAV